MEVPAQNIRQLEYHICPLAAVGQKRCIAKSLSDVAEEEYYPNFRAGHIA
jgi:hypothetical protein